MTESSTSSTEAIAVDIKPSMHTVAIEWSFRKSKAARFLPAVMTCCIWLYVATFDNPIILGTDPAGSLWNEFWNDDTKYYAMSLAMIFGSMIAGSTPLGGGVVAFPIAVLVIGFKPGQGRDFTLIIQAVGMNCAAYMLGIVKPHLLDFNLIAGFTFMGIPGMLMAFSLALKPFYIVLTFQLLVLEFGFVYFYLNVLSPRIEGGPSSPSKEKDVVDGHPPDKRREYLAYVLMVLCGFIGGFFSGNCGSGSDIMLYVFGVLVWNVLMPHRAYSEGVLTGSSVVTMGLISLTGALSRALTQQISSPVYLCWGATVWIVCWGAPVGSLLLTPSLQAYLRIIFYILSICQFVGFAVIKIEGQVDAWVTFAIVNVVVFGGLIFHRFVRVGRIQASGNVVQPISLSSIVHRLISK